MTEPDRCVVCDVAFHPLNNVRRVDEYSRTDSRAYHYACAAAYRALVAAVDVAEQSA